MVEGPVGAGKSTYCKSLVAQSGGVHIALDEWYSKLFSPDRPTQNVMAWYADHKGRLIELIWSHARALVAAKVSPVLELGLIRREDRDAIYRLAQADDIALTMAVLDAPRDVRRERVAQRNREQGSTYSMTVPPDVFEMASDLWEAPDDAEISERAIRLIAH